MGPDTGKHLRNIAILVGIALAVWLLPGGRTGSATVANLLSIILLGGLGFFAFRLYMEHRVTLLDLPDRMRSTLYGSFAVLAFALVATGRLTGAGGLAALLWIALVLLAVYGIDSVYRASREY